VPIDLFARVPSTCTDIIVVFVFVAIRVTVLEMKNYIRKQALACKGFALIYHAQQVCYIDIMYIFICFVSVYYSAFLVMYK